jgi:hypothetical protein
MATTTITGTINGVNNTALANKWITFRLVQLGTDSVATATVAQSVDSVQTDANGDFSIGVWNNGDSGKPSVLEITIDGSKAESVIIPTATATIELWDLIENYQADGSTSEQVPTVSDLFLRKASNLAELTPTASTARANIGVTIGTNVQAHSAVLDATTASFTAADEIKLDGVEALADVTDATNIAASGGYVAGGTDVALTDGGTGASDAPAARTNLGVSIGTDVQAHSAVLDATTASFTTAKDTAISTNTANIASNDTDIATNVTAIATNATGIATNVTAIALNTAKDGVTTAQAAAIALNTAKVTNATHTGDVTGDTALTIATDAVDIPMLSATGTPNSTSFLRGDNTWSVPAGGGGGDVATDAIWDAAGDLAVGTGADSASKLSIGTNGQVLTSNGSTATWASVNTGNGDMLASVYDPNTIAGDAFSMNNMIEGTNTKILTPTERSNIASNTSALANLGPASAYPYTTDFQSGVAQTRDLSNVDNLDGYKNNSNLNSIYIGSHVTSIDFQGFFGTDGLTSIKIPETVITLGQGSFSGSGLTSVSVPDSVTDMGASSTFDGCLSLTSAIIGSNVPTIPIFGLANNPLLSSVSLGSSVTTIGASAFQGDTGLTSIALPSGVTSIGTSAFSGCTTLASISIASNAAPTLGSNAFLNVSATTVQVPIGATGYSATYGGLTVVYV